MVTKVSSVPIVFDWLHFGNAVCACRLEAGLTLYQVGQLCDLSSAAIHDIEKATYQNALMSTVLVIANLYDLDIRAYFILSDTRIKAKPKRRV